MKIKFKNAAIIWSILAVSLVAKNIVTEDTNSVINTPANASDKGEYSFIVNVHPSGAKVMIMNINPKYKKGMILPKGKYDIKVSKHGYKSERVWVEHTDDSPYIFRLMEVSSNG